MAVYDADSSTTHPLDYQLAANGFVTLFWRRTVLDETCAWLTQRGYRVVQVDTSSWVSETDMHNELAASLGFPDYYGRNFAALADCLSDVGECALGLSQNDAGLTLVLVGFDRFLGRDAKTANTLLDIYARQARIAALIGSRMLCLIQSDDPHLRVRPVGATEVGWNPAEWLDSQRRP